MTRERCIPFDVSIDPFYSSSNLDLRTVRAEADHGVNMTMAGVMAERGLS